MRVPLTPALSTKIGSGNVNARMTNCLKEVRKAGERVVARPGLVGVSQFEGDGRGMVCFDRDLIGVFGTTLTRGVVEQQEVEEYLFPGGDVAGTYPPIAYSIFWQGEFLYGGGWSSTTNDDHVLNATEDFGETISVTVLPPAGGAEGGFFFTKGTDIYLLGGATPKIWKLEGSTWGTPVTVESGSVMSEGFVCSSAGLLYDCSATEVWEYDEELDVDLIYPAILCRVTDLETGELLASSTHITGEAGGRLPNVALGELGGQVYGFWSDPFFGQYTVFTVDSAATQTDVYTGLLDWDYYFRPGGGRMVALDGKLYTVFVTEVTGSYQAAVIRLDVIGETLSTVSILEAAAPLSENSLMVSIAVHGEGLSVLLGSADLPDIGDGTLFEIPLEGTLPPIGAIEAGFYDFAVSPL